MITRRKLAGGMGAATVAGVALASTAAKAQSTNEPTFDRVRRTKILRVVVVPGSAPYFQKDQGGTWSGAAIEMAKDIAEPLGAKLEYVESTYPNSVLDLASGRADIGFALNPTGERALSITFTHPYYMAPYTFLAKGDFKPKTWSELNDAKVRACAIQGSLAEFLLRRYAPRAQITTFRSLDDGVMAIQSSQADCIISAALQALSVKSRNPLFQTVTVAEGPRIAMPTCLGIRAEADQRWRDFLNAWIDYNRFSGQILDWVGAELAKTGIKREDVPSDL